MRKSKQTIEHKDRENNSSQQRAQADDIHFARSTYNYDDNYSDYGPNDNFRAYQDFSESGIRTDEADAPRRNFEADDSLQEARDVNSQSHRTFDHQSDDQHYRNANKIEDGSHSGKGPKGYRRSDERINEDVCESLSRNSEIDASEIDVSVAQGIVTLDGTVESRHIKRLAENIINDLSGVVDINNNLRIDTTLASKGTTHQSRKNQL